MKYNIALLAVVAGISVTALAQRPMTLMSTVSKPASGIVSRDMNKTQALGRYTTKDAFILNTARSGEINKAKARVFKADNPYGTVVELIYEDFSKMSTGSIESPDLTTEINYDYWGGECEYPWWNLKPEYTGLPNWGANYAWPAGGCVCLNANKTQEGGSINTPLVDASDYCGIVTLQFKARTLEGSTNGLIVESAETYNMSPSWKILGNTSLPEVTSEWRTYEVTFYGAGSSTLFNIVLMDQTSVYIDDVKVYQIDQHVDTPVTLSHSNYTGHSFVANWKAVEGADAYLLNVYSYDDNDNPVDLLVDKLVEGTSFTVEGIESGLTYYYTVRSVKGTYESIETLPVEVFDLAAPVLNRVDEIADGVYTASWGDVPTAERYNYWAYNVRTADADGEFVVTDENFDGITDAEGNYTGLKIDDEFYNCYDESYLPTLKQAGWRGKHYYPYTDFVMVDGWQYMNGQGDAGLISPELDLSKDGGKVNLSVSLYGEIENLWTEDGLAIPTQTESAIALFNYDEATGDYVQAEIKYPAGVSPEWKKFDVQFTKGTARSVIGIYAVKSTGHLFIDDLKITQNYKQGESLLEPFFFQRWNEGTSVEVTLPGRIAGQPIYHKVSAVKARSLDAYSTEFTESDFSALELVTDNAVPSSIADKVNGCNGATVTSDGNNLYVENPQGERVYVYAVDGTLVFSDNSGNCDITVPVKSNGIYIVKVGRMVVKTKI